MSVIERYVWWIRGKGPDFPLHRKILLVMTGPALVILVAAIVLAVLDP